MKIEVDVKAHATSLWLRTWAAVKRAFTAFRRLLGKALFGLAVWITPA
jgi:hypothetical protein